MVFTVQWCSITPWNPLSRSEDNLDPEVSLFYKVGCKWSWCLVFCTTQRFVQNERRSYILEHNSESVKVVPLASYFFILSRQQQCPAFSGSMAGKSKLLLNNCRLTPQNVPVQWFKAFFNICHKSPLRKKKNINAWARGSTSHWFVNQFNTKLSCCGLKDKI